MAGPAGQPPVSNVPPPQASPPRPQTANPRKRQRDSTGPPPGPPAIAPAPGPSTFRRETNAAMTEPSSSTRPAEQGLPGPPPKKGRTNTPWTPAEEHRLKLMRDDGKSWSEIAKAFPLRTEGSVKKHWYKDMHYAEFAEDESAALLAAIKEYEANKWKVIGQKVGKPAKACEQYAKEHGFISKT